MYLCTNVYGDILCNKYEIKLTFLILTKQMTEMQKKTCFGGVSQRTPSNAYTNPIQIQTPIFFFNKRVFFDSLDT